MPRRLTYRDTFWFFVPLLLWAQLMMITHSVIHAALARLPFPTVALAAFSVAIAVHSTLSSATVAMTQVGISFITNRRAMHRLVAFGAMLIAPSMALSWIVALTPVGEAVYAGLFGASEEVVRQAQAASLVLGMVFPVQMSRNLAVSLLMKARRTFWISVGTALRLSSLAGFLLLLRPVLTGAALGAAALGLCMLVEMSFIWAAAARFYLRLPREEAAPPPYLEIWRFSWPVIANMITENGIGIVINFFLGRLARPDLALASFGVARGLAMLLLSPLRNIAQTAQSLVFDRDDLRVMLRFTLGAVCVFTALVVALFYTPLQGWVLGTVMGLEPHLAAYTAAATLVFAVMPLAWSLASAYRGLLAGVRLTGALATAGVLRLIAVLGVSATCLFLPHVNGAVVGISSMAAAFGVEAVLLGRHFHRQVRSGRVLAPRNAAREGA